MPWPSCSDPYVSQGVSTLNLGFARTLSRVLQRFRCFFGKGKEFRCCRTPETREWIYNWVTATKIMPSGSIGDASFDNGPKSLQHGHRLRVRNGENFVEAPFDSKGGKLFFIRVPL
ncbi:hypothetical protein CC2G_002229 [Coprinopsis cinerea AmutBmut pab1-1]|nr:hypothetical protein CC2G_002229 [Coprinopsis cinerea AmutBmut pab1-1]